MPLDVCLNAVSQGTSGTQHYDAPLWHEPACDDRRQRLASGSVPLPTVYGTPTGGRYRELMDLGARVEQGLTTDVAAAQELIAEARRWLAERSIDQWQDPIPDRVLEEDVQRGNLFVVRADDGLAGMLAVARSDEDTWGPSSARALYVHRLAVAQRYRGAQLGPKLLRWAQAHAADQGMDRLRLDCAASNPGLRRFYERDGFTYVRDAIVGSPDGRRTFSVSLYQRPIGAH